MQRDDMPLPICFLDSDDQEREHHIKSLGELMLQSYADGDRQAAQQWLQLQQEAIKARSPAYIKQLEEQRGLV